MELLPGVFLELSQVNFLDHDSLSPPRPTQAQPGPGPAQAQARPTPSPGPSPAQAWPRPGLEIWEPKKSKR